MPGNLGEVSSGVAGGKIVVVGEGSSNTYLYSPGSNRWSTGAKRPCVGNHHCTVNYQGKMYLVGGLDGGCGRQFQVFDGRSWSKLPDLPFTTGSGSCGASNGKIVVCGGTDEKSTTNKCATYNLGTKKWTTNARGEKRAVNHAAYCTQGSKMFMVGGRGGGNTVGSATNTCQTYDLTKGAAGGCKSLPYPVGGAGACLNERGAIWVFGGELNGAQFRTASKYGGKAGGRGRVLTAVSFYKNGSWRQTQNMPVGKHGIQPVQVGGYVYVIGGGVVAGQSTTATGYRAKLADLEACAK